MECLFLIIVFIIIIASEYLPDKWLLVATIGTFLIVMSIIRQIIKIKKINTKVKQIEIEVFSIQTCIFAVNDAIL